jgi:phage gpG-like protein
MPLEGVDEFAAALGAWRARVREATLAGVEVAADELKETIQAALERSEYPPASEPGSPPAIRTGALRDSVQTTTEETGTGAQGLVWPSTVYARIQELGGDAGRDHRSHLPPRPYVQPSIDEVEPRVGELMRDAWQRAAQP